MNCQEIQELLTPYLLGDLDAGRAAEVQAHLQTCESCRAGVAELQATLHLLREGLADTSGVPSRLPESFIQQFKKRRWRLRRPRIIRFQPAPARRWIRITEYAAVAAVLLILAGVILPGLLVGRYHLVSKLEVGSDMGQVVCLPPAPPAPTMPASRISGQYQLGDADKPVANKMVEVRRGSVSRFTGDIPPPQPFEMPPAASKTEIADDSLKPTKSVAFKDTWGVSVGAKAESSGKGGGGLAAGEELRKKGSGSAVVTAEVKSGPESKAQEIRDSRLAETPAFTGGVAGKYADADSDAHIVRGVDRIGLTTEAAKPLEIAARPVAGRDESRVTADYAENKPAAPMPAREKEFNGKVEVAKQAEVAEKFAEESAPMAGAKAPAFASLSGKAPDAYLQPAGPAAAPAIDGRVETSGKDKKAVMAETEAKRLAGVREFQKAWTALDGESGGGAIGAGGYVHGRGRAVRAVSNMPPGGGVPATTVPPPEPAVRNAPPVTVPVTRATGVNPFVSAADKPFSTFSIDVDTASYTLSRNYLLRGQLPPPEAVRTEEFVNYFDYDYAPPAGPTFAVYTDCGPTAFGRGLSLLKIGIKGRRLGREEKRPAVLTLLIDTSGSMATPDRIELVKSALAEMVGRLDPADKVAIVQYDSHARLLLEHTPASDKKRILAVIEGLQTSGSTALEEGMREAYAVAARGFNSAACNRVLLLSDGMANLGATAAEDILASITAYRKQGITLSVFGFGLGAYNDVMLESLANKGDGVYAFIDSPAEAKRVLVDDLAATVNLIARDVKIQVEFNSKRVKKYRQLGYENRQLKKEEFRDDRVDAGEIGSGQSVTALYELDLQGDSRDPLGIVRVRCQNALTGQIEEIEQPILPAAGAKSFEAMDVRFRLAAAAAEFSEILRGSPFAAGSRFEDVARVLRPISLELSLDNRIAELLRLTQTGLTPKFREPENP